MRTVKLLARLHGMRIACPRTAGHTTHHIPQHSGTQDFVYPVTAVAHHAETAVDGFSDTYATSQILAAAINKIGVEKDDIVLCGRQAIDGDTAQVGPQISEHLGLPVISYAQKIREVNEAEKYIVVERQYDDRYHVVKAQLPCLLTALAELNEPRYMTPGGIFDAYAKEITVWGRKDLKDVEDSNLGLKGSPTQIAKASDKVRKGAGEKVELDPAASADYIVGKLAEKHII